MKSKSKKYGKFCLHTKNARYGRLARDGNETVDGGATLNVRIPHTQKRTASSQELDIRVGDHDDSMNDTGKGIQ